MSKFECTSEKPWGIHPFVRNDQDCPRCGWTAPGPMSDALAARQRMAAEQGWTVIEGGASLAA
jgi:hypothetical protein